MIMIFFLSICFLFLDEWIMCDDEYVTPVTEEDVMKLSGGGDRHTAYLLIYGPRTIEYEDQSNEGASGESNLPRSFVLGRFRPVGFLFRRFPCHRILFNVSATGSVQFRQTSDRKR